MCCVALSFQQPHCDLRKHGRCPKLVIHKIVMYNAELRNGRYRTCGVAVLHATIAERRCSPTCFLCRSCEINPLVQCFPKCSFRGPLLTSIYNYGFSYPRSRKYRVDGWLVPDIKNAYLKTAGPSGRAVYGVGLQPLAYWDCGFESHGGAWAWMFVCCECCVMSGRGLCDELITRPEESHRLWCVVVRDNVKTTPMRGLSPQKQNKLSQNWFSIATNTY